MATSKKRTINRRLSGLTEIALPPDECPVSQVLELIGHKWAVQVLGTLDQADRPLRFRELQRSLNRITQKELTNRLRELETSGMVHRRAYAEVPPRVEYRMTELGRTIMPLMLALAEWVKKHRPTLNVKGGTGRDTHAIRTAMKRL
jgi:DNA-binding HxlR family transcriptional regulator